MASHARVGIEHAPVEVTVAAKLVEAAAALAHLLLLVLGEPYTRLLAHAVAPLARQQRLDGNLVIEAVGHDVAVLREASHLLVEDVE